MYEDFTYITDEVFLANFWREEPIRCQHCHGQGSIASEVLKSSIPCKFCAGTGTIKREQATLKPL